MELIIKRNGKEIESRTLPVGDIEVWIGGVHIRTIEVEN